MGNKVGYPVVGNLVGNLVVGLVGEDDENLVGLFTGAEVAGGKHTAGREGRQTPQFNPPSAGV